MDTKQTLVFLSHAAEDSAVASAICEAIERDGFRCWIAPRDIAAGTDYAISIMAALDRATMLLVVVSPASCASPHVVREVERAVSRGITILPVRIAEFSPSGPLDYFLGTCQSTDAFPGPIELHADSFLYTLKRVYERASDLPGNTKSTAHRLAQLRTEMLAAASLHELRRVRFEVERVLAMDSSNPETKALLLQLRMATRHSTEMAAPMCRPLPRRRYASFVVLVLILAVATILVLWLIRK